MLYVVEYEGHYTAVIHHLRLTKIDKLCLETRKSY